MSGGGGGGGGPAVVGAGEQGGQERERERASGRAGEGLIGGTDGERGRGETVPTFPPLPSFHHSSPNLRSGFLAELPHSLKISVWANLLPRNRRGGDLKCFFWFLPPSSFLPAHPTHGWVLERERSGDAASLGERYTRAQRVLRIRKRRNIVSSLLQKIS